MTAGSTTWRQVTPLGDIELVLGPAGIERVTLPMPDRQASVGEARSRDPATATSRRVTAIARQVDAYFAGRRTELDAEVDLTGAGLSDLQRHVLLTVRAEVLYGETATYGEVAELAGRPGAARAVGTAMARNPVPLFVPCHRVVAANGIGGYGGGSAGVALRRALLELERRARPNG